MPLRRFTARKLAKRGMRRPIGGRLVRPSGGRPLRAYYPHSRTRTKPGDAVLYKGIGIPDRFYTTLKYSEQFSMVAGVGAPYQVYQYRGNSLYDPNFTGTGAQPQWFDQICGTSAMYTQYLVIGSKISLRLASQTDSFASGNIDVCLTPSQTPYLSTAWAGIDDQISYRASKRQSVVRYDNAGVKYLTSKADTASVLDVKDLEDNLVTIAGTSTSNPSNVWYWIIGMQGMDRTSTTSSLNVLVNITYYVRFYNTSDRPQS